LGAMLHLVARRWTTQAEHEQRERLMDRASSIGKRRASSVASAEPRYGAEQPQPMNIVRLRAGDLGGPRRAAIADMRESNDNA